MDIGRTTAESIANAHGNAAFNRIEAIRFTFNAENRGEKFAERSWIWEPPKDRVTLISSDPVNKKLNQQ